MLFASSHQWQCVHDPSYLFIVKSAQDCLDDVTLLSSTDATRWNTTLPIKINIFQWKKVCKRLPTKEGVDISSLLCLLCGDIVEESVHLFLKCGVVQQMWRFVLMLTSFCLIVLHRCVARLTIIWWLDSLDL